MQPEILLEQIMAYFDHHVLQAQGVPWQEPDPSELFKLFTVAYHRGLTSHAPFTGNSIQEACITRWHPDTHSNSQLYHLLGEVCLMWNAWQYALDHHPDKNA